MFALVAGKPSRGWAGVEVREIKSEKYSALYASKLHWHRATKNDDLRGQEGQVWEIDAGRTMPGALPYWNVNVPESQRSDECPSFLANIRETDEAILSIPDSEHGVLSWPEVVEIVRAGRIHEFHRQPSNLRRYLYFLDQVKHEYGSVIAFVKQQRLQWNEEDLSPHNDTPFADPDDLSILKNDWPYAIDSRIVHLVVWVKFALPDTPSMIERIALWVQRTFESVLGKEQVVWFKNTPALKSIHAIEHFHVMLFSPPTELVERITHNDVGMFEKVQT